MVRGDACRVVCVTVGISCASVPGCGGHGAHVDPDASLGEVTIKTFPDGVPSVTGQTDNAMLVAFQDGDGPWIALTGTGGVYHASPVSLRYGVAVGCVANGRSSVDLYYQSLSHSSGTVQPGAAPPARYATLDAAMRQPDDTSSVVVFAEAAIDPGATVGYSRIARRSFKDPVAQSITLPDLVAVQAPVVATTGAPWLTATIPIVPSRLGHLTYEAVFGGTVSAPDDRSWTVAISADWAAIQSSGQSSVTISLPDLSNLPGWRPEMALDAAAYDGWNIGWIDRNMPISTLPVDGREIVESLAISAN